MLPNGRWKKRAKAIPNLIRLNKIADQGHFKTFFVVSHSPGYRLEECKLCNCHSKHYMGKIYLTDCRKCELFVKPIVPYYHLATHALQLIAYVFVRSSDFKVLELSACALSYLSVFQYSVCGLFVLSCTFVNCLVFYPPFLFLFSGLWPHPAFAFGSPMYAFF